MAAGSKIAAILFDVSTFAEVMFRRTIMRRILSEVLRRRNGVARRKGRAGALRIEFIERSRDECLGIEWVFADDGSEWSA